MRIHPSTRSHILDGEFELRLQTSEVQDPGVVFAVDIEEFTTVDAEEEIRDCLERFGQHSLTV
jgi:hypothetical protein